MKQSVETTSGTIRGEQEGGVLRYAGIPFAHVPQRFRRPRPLNSGIGQLPNRWGPAPWQPLPGYDELGAERAEDCLNLNVWSPVGADRVPVIVWVYGGGWEHGSNASPGTRGDVLAATGRAVIVSVNYRVTALGWAELAHCGGELSEASNLGLHDIVTALEWIQANIASFGGDPSRVTVMGESAGGFNLSALLGSSRGRATFSGIAAFSGGASRIIPLTAAQQLGDRILIALGGDPLRCCPEELVAAQSSVVPTDIGRRNGVVPESLGVVDDSALPHGILDEHPMEALAAGRAAHKAVWFGSTRDEASLFAAHAPDVYAEESFDELVGTVKQWTGSHEKSGSAVEAYTSDAGADAAPLERLVTDWVYALPSARGALCQAAAGGRAYLSMFGRADGKLAGHAADVPALFGRLSTTTGPEDRARRDEVREAVLRFAEEGSPGWSAVGKAPTSMTLGPDKFDSTRAYSAVLDRWQGVPRP